MLTRLKNADTKFYYKITRNALFLALTTYLLWMYNFGLLTSYVGIGISSIFITGGFLLTETMGNLAAHKKQFLKLATTSSSLDLRAFTDEGEHLPSLHKEFQRLGVKMKTKSEYLGSNKTMFELPYKFIMDVNRSIKRVNEESIYIDKVKKSAFDDNKNILYTNTMFDELKKTRWEFFLANMVECDERDSLLDKYTKKFGKPPFSIKSSAEARLLKEQQELEANIVDHLEVDLMENIDLDK